MLVTLLGTFAGCTAAQIESIDPTVYVEGESCPDAQGTLQPLIAGYVCCTSQGLGPGQCPEDTSCMTPDSCTTSPLPPNDGRTLKPLTFPRSAF